MKAEMHKGVPAVALRARAAPRVGLLVPPENAAEAAAASGLQLTPVQNLRQAAGSLEGEVKISPVKADVARISDNRPRTGRMLPT